MGRRAALASVGLALLGAAGCGGEGVAENAALSVYVSAPLCAEAKRELARSAPHPGGFRLRAVCVDEGGRGGESRLAAIGAAARRATEDSSSVAYIGSRDALATRFSEPILDAADVPRISSGSGAAAMAALLAALRRTSGSDSPRESLRDELR